MNHQLQHDGNNNTDNEHISDGRNARPPTPEIREKNYGTCLKTGFGMKLIIYFYLEFHLRFCV